MSASSRGRGDGEFELLARLRAEVNKGPGTMGVVVGIGDDCAVVRAPASGARLLLTTDTMIEGVHFRRAWLTPRELGVRAFRAAVSDIAATGGRPRYVLLSLEVPGSEHGFGSREALALSRAVAAAAHRSGAALVGGNVSGAATIGVTVTVVGEAARRPLLRSGARAGDLVFVTGALGGAAAGWRALVARDGGGRRTSVSAAQQRRSASAWRRPPLRLAFAAALADRALAHAMIDVSDGLLQDLGHIARESRLAIRVDPAAVPVHPAAAATSGLAGAPAPLELALGGGEDYELAFTAARSRRAAIEALAATQRTPLRVIGVVEKGRSAVTDPEGRAFALATAGFDHLRPRRSAATRKR